MDRISELPSSLQVKAKQLFLNIDTNVDLKSVIIDEENKVKLDKLLNEHYNRDKIIKYGLSPINKVLMYGASGTGKTYLSRALANHLNYTMLCINIADALSTGDIASNISTIFTVANKLKRCIVFLDECDSIAWCRDTNNPDTGDIRRATNSILQQVDQMDKDNIFISATNMIYKLDAAFERRFDLKMEFKRLEINLIETIKKFIIPEFTLEDDSDNTTSSILERRVNQNIKLSYYEIKCIVEREIKRAIIDNTTVLKTSNIYDDFKRTMNIKINFNSEGK